jgi:hypothetical protein
MDSTLQLKVEVKAGADKVQASCDAQHLAMTMGIEILYRFNSDRFVVYPDGGIITLDPAFDTWD